MRISPDSNTLTMRSADGDKLGCDSTPVTVAALKTLAGKPASVAITLAPGGSNVCVASIAVRDADGRAPSSPVALEVWLSDAATGAGETATTASGAVQGTLGTDLLVFTAKKRLRVLTDAATGDYQLSITDSANTGFYVAVQRGESLTVSAQLVTGNYG